MGWALSTFLDTASSLEALRNALKHGMPEIVNSDQGCQFTSAVWVETLQQLGIFISIDGKGRWADNVYVERLWRTIKQEAVLLYRFISKFQLPSMRMLTISLFDRNKLPISFPSADFLRTSRCIKFD